jgi:hypothetical protein
MTNKTIEVFEQEEAEQTHPQQMTKKEELLETLAVLTPLLTDENVFEHQRDEILQVVASTRKELEKMNVDISAWVDEAYDPNVYNPHLVVDLIPFILPMTEMGYKPDSTDFRRQPCWYRPEALAALDFLKRTAHEQNIRMTQPTSNLN